MQLEVVDVWKAWQKFPEWFKTYWGSYSPPEDGGDTEWSNGVIFPFIVTSFAPSLNCKVRMEINRYDVLLVRDEDYIMHIEHENVMNNLKGELKKMSKSTPRIKCGISYGQKYEIRDELKMLNEYLSKSFNNVSMQEWIFIFGIYGSDGYLRDVHSWEAYHLNDKEVQML